MNQNSAIIALDVGEKRIGMAVAETGVKIAHPLTTVTVDGQELHYIADYIEKEGAATVVLGYPRNQAGEATAQTAYVEAFAERLKEVTDVPLVFQDESLTSVLAEERLRSYGKPYTKDEIDAQAATLILQDYLEIQ